MKTAIATAHTVSEISDIVAAWRTQERADWRLVILTEDRTIDDLADIEIVHVTRTSALGRALRIAAGCDLAWLLRQGRRPEAGSVAVITHWFDQRNVTDVAYGDSAYTGAEPVVRPRYGRERMLSTGDCGDSLVMTGTVARQISSVSSWHELVIAVVETSAHIDHIPVILDAGPALPAPSRDERAQALAKHSPAFVNGCEYPVLRGPVAGQSVSIVIPSIGSLADIAGATQPALLACLASILERDTSLIAEIIIVAGEAMPAETLSAARELAGDMLRVVTIDGPFNFSASCNLGASISTGTHLLFLNDDVETVTDDWLGLLLGAAMRPNIGAVGARLLFPDGTLQHCGITVRPDTCEPNHLYYRHDPGSVTDPSASACGEFLAVTGACLLISQQDFETVGGFSLSLPVNYNDVDLCLKLGSLGKATVSCNSITLIHRESTSRIPTITAAERGALDVWKAGVQNDPFWYAWS